MAILCCRSFHVNLIFLILYFCTPFRSFTETFSQILSFDPCKNPMKQASRHAVLMYFTHERIKAYGSQCFTQVSRLISGISGCRTQISCLLVLCLLHNVTVLQVDRSQSPDALTQEIFWILSYQQTTWSEDCSGLSSMFRIARGSI